jgi:hypothetical protein
MSTLIPNLTFRVVRMPAAPGLDVSNPCNVLYVAIAWNYDHAQLIATHGHANYQAARSELNELVAERKCALRWFDGEYQVAGDGEQIVPVACPVLRPEQEQEMCHRA